jgi:hypothetical protein
LIVLGEVAIRGGKILAVHEILEMTANKNLSLFGTHHA